MTVFVFSKLQPEYKKHWVWRLENRNVKKKRDQYASGAVQGRGPLPVAALA